MTKQTRFSSRNHVYKSFDKIVVACVGTEQETSGKFLVYPNPNNCAFFISTDAAFDGIQLYNQIGQRVNVGVS